MRFFAKPLIALLTCSLLSAPLGAAYAHPHIFVDATVTIDVNDDGTIEKLHQQWDFDVIFSSSVVLDFDANKNRRLDPSELETITHTIKESVAEFGFFQSISQNNKPIAMAVPDPFFVTMAGKKLRIVFDNKPEQALKLEKGHHYVFSVTDPSFYVAVMFPNDGDFHINHLPNYCKATVVRPDVDKVLSQSRTYSSEEFFNNPAAALDLSVQLATRLEVQC